MTLPCRYLPALIAPYLLKFTLAVLILLQLQATQVMAQPAPPDVSYLRLQWLQQRFEGLTQYMLYHNTTATNLPYHQHYIYDPFGNSTETNAQLQAEASYYLNRRTFVQANIPYVIKKRITADTLNMKESGLGDIMLGGGYQLFNSQLYKPDALWRHLFTVQAGVKLPSGIYQRFNDINEVEPHSMPGTGSLSFLFSATYYTQFKRISVWANANYRLNRANKYTYRFGNTYATELTLQYRQPLWKTIALMPQTGFSWQKQNQDYMNQKPSPEYTQAQWLMLHIGASLSLRHLQTGFTWQKPLWSKITGPQPKFTGQWQITLQYNLKQTPIKQIRPYRMMESN